MESMSLIHISGDNWEQLMFDIEFSTTDFQIL